MTDHSSPEKSPWGWKALIIAIILSIIFMVIFYVAIENEPDYMPSKQRTETSEHHAFKASPVMSEEAAAKIEANKAAQASATEHNMTEEEHAAMGEHSHTHDDQSGSHSH
ncbi:MULTISPECIES: hypothetical protein [unclassified Acinetobacter]|uniref:hypothetical protein n=1 Tax=unclassified Acinetobacter TaxID=196816 RepID=UPI0004528EF6|nr:MULTISPECIES: hypothetical protein [unclassified Acinetobacter]EZQ04977.1 hypothetical protein CL42_10590 [Acinetobacter sp. Ver3]